MKTLTLNSNLTKIHFTFEYISNSAGTGYAAKITLQEEFSGGSLGIKQSYQGNTYNNTNRYWKAAFNGTSSQVFVIEDPEISTNFSPNNQAIDFYTCDGTQNNTASSGIIQNLSLYNGNVGIGNTIPSHKLEVQGSIGTTASSTTNSITFTGIHRSFINNYSLETLNNSYGLIVSANRNDYTKLNNNICKGRNAITISESIPDLSITNKDSDKSVFGVISKVENSLYRTDEYGSLISNFEGETGDIRTF